VTSEIVGRDEELASIRAFLEREREAPAALVLEGEAGIGKSTLWLAGVEAARDRDFRVVSSRPTEAEQGLAFAGLGDLFEDVLEQVRPPLAPPRRRALEAALLLGEASEPADRRALGVAVRDALELLASAEPLVVAVDDVQWLDGSSAAALEFALRRLTAGQIVLLLTRRFGGPTRVLALPADRAVRLELGPLSLGAIHRLLWQRLGRSFPRPTLLRIHALSNGNPFFALELAHALERAGPSLAAADPFPVPSTLDALLGDRLEAMPEETRVRLLAVSALADPTLSVLESIWPGSADALEPAVRAEVVSLDGERVRFAHPLLASVLYERAPPSERRHLHSRLAECVHDPVEQARHFALAVEGPDPVAAARLDEAAAHARLRGAPIAAAELGELAIRATPREDTGDSVRRILQTARDHLAAGAVDRARMLGEELCSRVQTGPVRAEALVLLSEVEGQEGSVNHEIELLRSALRAARGAPGLRIVAELKLGHALRFSEGTAAGIEHARIALELAKRIGDPTLESRALATLAELMLYAGEDGAIPLAEQSLALARRAQDQESIDHALWSLGCCLAWAGRATEARAALLEAHESLAHRDDVKARLVLWLLAVVELRAGNWNLARDYARQRLELSEMLAEDDPNASIPLALVSAYQGDEREARALAERGIRLAETSGRPFFASWHRGVLGQLELWSGSPARAVELFAAAMDARSSFGFNEPGSPLYRADYVEALIELGRIDEARALLDAWEEDAARLGRDWALAEAERCRGLVAAAEGDVALAQRLLESAVSSHASFGDPFARARALLGLGAVRRRARQKRAAREAIEDALAAFEELGAARWAETARAELGRIGGRRREKGLTPAERRVAALVAEGKTNREVASVLVLGERTVETHLTHIYAKLGVRSRTELARAFGPDT
jgi:DNA-binding CsgD family transcriptional regulator